MRLYTSKKEAEILQQALESRLYKSHDPKEAIVLGRLIHRIDICLELQENEEKGGVSDETNE